MAKKSPSKAKRRRADKARKVETVNLGKIPTIMDAGIKTVWIDRMQLFQRSDLPLATISFSSLIPPDKLVEVGRFQTTVTHLKSIIDVLCRTTDYYPTKKSSAKPAS